MAKYQKSEYIYLQGKVSWFRPKIPDQWNNWSTQLHPNPESLEKIRELQAEGIKNQIKKDDDGYFTRFKRPVTKETKTGKILSFAPVEVFDADGKPFDGPVGNGSDATLKIEVYEHGTPGGGTAKAARWVSARIDNLVPFSPDTDYNDEQKAAAEGVMQQPEQLF